MDHSQGGRSLDAEDVNLVDSELRLRLLDFSSHLHTITPQVTPSLHIHNITSPSQHHSTSQHHSLHRSQHHSKFKTSLLLHNITPQVKTALHLPNITPQLNITPQVNFRGEIPTGQSNISGRQRLLYLLRHLREETGQL